MSDVTYYNGDGKPTQRVGNDPTQPLQTQLTGSIAPNKANAWTLAQTVPYTSFAANSTNFFKFSGVLNPAAKKRAILIAHTLNVGNNSAITYYAADSLSVGGAQVINGVVISNITTATLSADTGSMVSVILGSDQYPIIGTPSDSFIVTFPIGATAPTSGNVYIYYREVL